MRSYPRPSSERGVEWGSNIILGATKLGNCLVKEVMMYANASRVLLYAKKEMFMHAHASAQLLEELKRLTMRYTTGTRVCTWQNIGGCLFSLKSDSARQFPVWTINRFVSRSFV